MPKWRTVVKVVLPTALAGIVTGITLAVARVIGETAPLLVIAGLSDSVNFNLFDDRMATLPVFAYSAVTSPGVPPGPSIDRAWGAALVLLLIVMLLNLVARLVSVLLLTRRASDELDMTATRPAASADRTKGSTDMATSIDVSDLNIYYGDFLAVEDVNLPIGSRSVTAIIGPSGCGKSTFLRSLNRMHEVIRGRTRRGQGPRRGPGPLRPRHGPGRRPPHGRHGLPAAQPVPDDVDLRQRPRRARSSTASG